MVKAIRFHQAGGPEVLQLEDITLPPPGPGEVRVKIAAAGLNFIDVYQRKGLYPVPMPSGLGGEASGTIEAIGEGVTGFAVGDPVAYGTAPLGSYAEAANVPAAIVLKRPKDVADETAAAIMLKGMTAEYLLRRTYKVEPGDTIVFYAAAGGVGLIACQWAKALSATVIGIVGNDEKAALARANGCAHTLILGRDDIPKKVRELTNGRGVPVVYDSVGKDSFDISLDCLAPRGLLASFGSSSGPVGIPDLGVLARKGSLYVTRASLYTYTATRGELEESAAALFDVVRSGKVKIAINQRYKLADTAQAHRDLEGRKTTGATILLP